MNDCIWTQMWSRYETTNVKCIENVYVFGLVLGYRGFWITLRDFYCPTKIMLLTNIKVLHFLLKTFGLYLYKIWIQYIVQLLSNNKHCHKAMSCAIIIRYCIHSYTNLAERHNGNESQLGSKKIIPTLFKLNSHSIHLNATT